MKKTLFSALLIVSLIISVDCKEGPPVIPPEQPPEKKMSLTLQDTTCTEAWIKLTFANFTPPHSFKIYRDDTVAFAGMLSADDTTVIDTALLPQRYYNYRAFRLENGVPKDSSSILHAKTMDTTSHEFIFGFDSIGDGASSVLFDAAILSDTSVWVVGEMYLKDSSGVIDPTLYNAAHWNGTQWEIIRIPYIYQGSPAYSFIKCLFAFNENDIWFSNSVHWNGQQFRNVDLAILIFYGIGMNKMWGNRTTGELYVVGNSGTIAYSPDQGSTWQRIESGTTANVNDVWGRANGSSGGSTVLAAASNRYSTGDLKLLQLVEAKAETLEWSLYRRPLTVWFDSPYKIYVGGTGVFVGQPGRWKEVITLPNNVSTRIRGTGKNDVWVVGAFGLCSHFNGLTWKIYDEVALQNGTYEGLAVTKDLVIAVGQVENRAIVIRGSRK